LWNGYAVIAIAAKTAASFLLLTRL